MLVSRYIDCFHGREGKISQKDLASYRKDLVKSIKNLEAYFLDEKLCCEGLLSYLSNVETSIKSFQKQLQAAEDIITDQVLDISPDVNHIVNFEDTLEIIHNAKAYFISSAEYSYIY